MLLELSSAAFSQRSANASDAWNQLCSSSPATCLRSDHIAITGNVGAIFFDFDGTLTATPGDRSERKFKIAELKERAPMLEPWLRGLKAAGLVLGIISKSSEDTILTALVRASLRDIFEGPIIAKAIGFEGKAGFIEELCEDGAPLSFLGAEGHRRVVLVDDDCLELARAREHNIQTFPAPKDGGLQCDDFFRIFQGLCLEPPDRPADSKEIRRLWTHGLVAEGLGLVDPELTQIEYPEEGAPVISDYYSIGDSEVWLGQGAFGVCAVGVHVSTGMRCAVKLMRKEVVGRHYLENFVEQDLYTFLLKMARWEPHPNVVRHLDCLMGPTMIYAAMELLEGVDFDTYLRHNAPITEMFAGRIMLQVLLALRHIHAVSGVGLIHRDVKLENLRFRTSDGDSDLVLVDFGLSCAAQPEQKRGIVGTLLYMAPEIFSSHYSTQVDLWSTGVVLYIILTGKPPWKQTPSSGLCNNKKLQNGTAVREALEEDRIASAPGAAADLLKGLLMVDPGARLTAASAIEHPWLSGGATLAGPVIGVEAAAYVSVHEYALQTPTAKLSLVVSMNDPDSDASPLGAVSPVDQQASGGEAPQLDRSRLRRCFQGQDLDLAS